MLGGEELREHLKKEGYEYLDAGRSKEGLGQYLSECRNSYRGNSRSQQQNSDNASHLSNTPTSTPITQPVNIKIEQKSGFDFWDIMLLSCLWGRGGNTTNIYNYAPSTNRESKESDNSVLGPCIAVFCLIFTTIILYVLIAGAAYGIKNAKLENNKYSVPIAIGLGIFSFSVSATLILLLSGMIVPNLKHAMRMSNEAFTAFQVIIGLNAVISGLRAILFFYLAIDKANKKALVDREVDQIINCNICSPGYGTSSSQHRGQQFPQHEQYQGERYQTRSCQDFLPSAPLQPPSYEESENSYQYYGQSEFSGYNPTYVLHQNNPFQQNPQPYFNNPDVAQYSSSKTSYPS